MFKAYNQFCLIPQNYKEYLGEEHEAIILEEIVNQLDLSELKNSYANYVRGSSAYHPKMLLTILFYGYMNETFSSRKLAKKLKSDLAFMYLSGNNKPDFRTINGFRKNKGKILEGIFVQIVLKAKELGLITFGTVNIDGTKIYANASKSKNQDIEGLEKKIEELFKEAEEIDKIEDDEYGENDDNIPKDLKTKEGREKKRKEIEEKKKHLEEKKDEVKKKIEKKKSQGIEQKRINTTDEDSRLMEMKHKDWGNGYNPQNITEKQFIISTRVPNTANDTQEYVPSLEKMKEQYGVLPKKTVADKAYGTVESYKYAKENNIDTYIPHIKFRQNLEDYKYNEKEDTYEDKEGNKYKFESNIYRKKGGKSVEGNVIKAKRYICKLGSGKQKAIKVFDEYRILCKENDKRLYSEEGKEIYRKRSGCVEPVFGNIKANLGFERFVLRGFEGVSIERNLICLVHNIKKLMKYMGKIA